jgi:voltage-gated sodium channel
MRTPPDRSGRLARLVDSDRFAYVISAVIVANAIVLGLETYPDVVAVHGDLLVLLNLVFYVVFFIELVLRMASYGRRPQDFFRSGWNIFDFVIIVGALIPGIRTQAQLLRLLRLLRVVRLLRYLPDARMLLASVGKALPSMFSVFVLTILLLFVYGMVGWTLFGESLPESWGTIGQAMMTLFILLTLENFPVYLEEAQAVSPFATVFFISYVLVAAFIVFNLLIGIVIGSMEKAREAEADALARENQQDPRADAALRLAEIRAALDALEGDLRRGSAGGSGRDG